MDYRMINASTERHGGVVSTRGLEFFTSIDSTAERGNRLITHYRARKSPNTWSWSEPRNRSKSFGESIPFKSRPETCPAFNLDEGYAFLSTSATKTDPHRQTPTLIWPTNSWPLRRKTEIGRELVEYEKKLDSSHGLLYLPSDNLKDSKRSLEKRSPSAGESVLLGQSNSKVDSHVGPGWTRTAETAIDYCTCMLCVKSVYYVCVDEEDEYGSEITNPCYCSRPSKGCFTRWSLLGLLACFLPCLFCYPPAKGCLRVSERYEKRRKNKEERHWVKYSKNRETCV